MLILGSGLPVAELARPPAEDDSDGGFVLYDADDAAETSARPAPTDSATDPPGATSSAVAEVPGAGKQKAALTGRAAVSAEGNKGGAGGVLPRGRRRRPRAAMGDGSGDELGAEFDGGTAAAAAAMAAAAPLVVQKPPVDKPSLASRGFAARGRGRLEVVPGARTQHPVFKQRHWKLLTFQTLAMRKGFHVMLLCRAECIYDKAIAGVMHLFAALGPHCSASCECLDVLDRCGFCGCCVASKRARSPLLVVHHCASGA